MKKYSAVKTLSVMPTYQCNAQCKHCGTFSSPRDNTWLSENLMLDAIRQAAENNYGIVVFTGGEATLAPRQLFRGIVLASSLGLKTRLVTNAGWADSPTGTQWMMDNLLCAGLNEINFSTGDQHARFVPLTNIFRAIRAAAERHLDAIVVMIETLENSAITLQTVRSHPDFVSIEREFCNAAIKIFESPWMPMSPLRKNTYPEGMAINITNLDAQIGCNSCLGTTTLQADGRIGACCGLGMRIIPELQLGHIGDTTIREADQRGQNDFLKRWIRLEGPVRILHWASKIDPAIEWENRYAHRCQACLRLYKDERVRTIIREQYTHKIDDILFAEWILDRFGDNPGHDAQVHNQGAGKSLTGAFHF